MELAQRHPDGEFGEDRPTRDLAAAESELRAGYRRLEEMGERNYISTTAGLLADLLYRQGRYEESAGFAGECEHLASPDDVASQFLWRCVRGKLKARQGDADEAESLLSAAMALMGTSDHLDVQGTGLLDFVEIRELAGLPEDAAALADRAARLFERKGNVVSALWARQLGERLRSSPAVPMRDYLNSLNVNLQVPGRTNGSLPWVGTR